MPRAPKQCGSLGCTTLVRGTTYCLEHAPKAWANSHSPASTYATRKLRREVLDEEPICMDCGVNRSTDMGHIIPASQGGPTERWNVKGQCRQCNLNQIRTDKQLYG